MIDKNRRKFSAEILKNIFALALIFSCVQFANAQTRNKISPARSPKNSASQIQTDTPERRRAIKTKADEISRLMLSADYEKMFELMHPKVRELVGGKESFIKLVGTGVESMAADGFKIISIENFEPEKITKVGRELFAIVPTKIKIQTPQGNLIQSACDIAISSDGGTTWLFVGGSNGKEKLEKLFPTTVGKIRFPESTLPVPEP